MKIEVWSDIACPYCYIGKRKLEMALSKFPSKNNIEIVWYSYELHPKLPRNVKFPSFRQYFAGNHDLSADEVKDKLYKIEVLAQEVGIRYNFDNLQVANTSDALRLVKKAKEYGKADEVEELLFKAYFVDGENVADKALLLRIATSVGLQQDDVECTLNSNVYLDEIKEDMDYSENELGLEYIPFYRFNERHIIQGSITVEDYLSVLEKAYAEWESGAKYDDNENENISGEPSCSIDGTCQ